MLKYVKDPAIKTKTQLKEKRYADLQQALAEALKGRESHVEEAERINLREEGVRAALKYQSESKPPLGVKTLRQLHQKR
jgi:hypothetical protein